MYTHIYILPHPYIYHTYTTHISICMHPYVYHTHVYTHIYIYHIHTPKYTTYTQEERFCGGVFISIYNYNLAC